MKNKGIVIELTALLDVILIMMFWLMMNLQNNNDNIHTDAENRISQAQQQVQTAEQNVYNAEKRAEDAVAEMEKMRDELEKVREDAEKEITEAWKKAASINDNAAANQLALDNYEQGLLITINLRYGTDAEILISDNNNMLEQTDIVPDNISQSLISAITDSGFGYNDVILCALTYDGNNALYRDVQAIREAVDDVKANYPNLYCTYINTKER